MVAIGTQQYAREGCDKTPSHGVAGSRNMVLCASHAPDGTVHVKSTRDKWCGGEGCEKHPSYGGKGTKKREFCETHKRDGMVDVAHKR